MKTMLTTLAVCLIAAPLMAGEVSEPTLSALGLGDMQTMTDSQGMEVRGKDSSFAMAIGTSLVFGQLVTPDTKNFVVGSDVNMVSANSQSTAAGVASTAGKNHISSISLQLNIADPAFLGTALGSAGGSGIASGGFNNITGFLALP